MAVSVLNAAVGIGDNNTNPLAPSAGTDRYWLIAVISETTWGSSFPSDITVSGTTSTTLGLIASVNGATMDAALYGCKDADIGTSPNTSNGSLTYNADGNTPGSTSCVVIGFVAEGVDQTTPFTNTEDDGWSVDSTNSTEDCPFTLDEIVDGLGVAFVGCSKTGTTWDLTDNSYAASGSGQWAQGTNTSGNAATKLISSQSLNQLTTFTSGLTGDKTCTLGIMLLAPSGDTTPNAFSFDDSLNQSISTQITSSIETITGMDDGTDISIDTGEYRINSGSWVTAAGTIDADDTVQIRVTTASTGRTHNDVTLTIGTVDGVWSNETDSLAILSGDIDSYSAPSGVQSFGHAIGNTSGAAFKEDSEQVAVIRNGVGIVYLYELGSYSTITKTITLTFDGLSDSEDLCDMGNGEFAICAEDGGRYSIHIFDWPTGTTVTSKQNLVIAATGTDNNSGAEGICYDRDNEVFYVVGEGQQASTDRQFYKVVRPTNTTTDYDYNDSELTVTEPFDAETAFNSLGTSGASWDLSGIDFDHDTGNVLISSDTGGEVAQVNVTTGSVIATLSISALSQAEGVAILPDGDLLVVGEAYEYQEFEFSTSGVISNPLTGVFGGSLSGVIS